MIVYFAVVIDGFFPAMVDPHHVFSHFFHKGSVFINSNTAPDGITDIINICMIEPYTISIRFTHIFYCINQSACTSNNRNRSVPQGIQLIQSTRLYPAGHQQEISSCIHQMAQSFVVSDVSIHDTRMRCGQLLQLPLNLRIPLPSMRKQALSLFCSMAAEIAPGNTSAAFSPTKRPINTNKGFVSSN